MIVPVCRCGHTRLAHRSDPHGRGDTRCLLCVRPECREYVQTARVDRWVLVRGAGGRRRWITVRELHRKFIRVTP